jgi:ligand-binding sensor domain-containing protein/signal transduction histidine kinase
MNAMRKVWMKKFPAAVATFFLLAQTSCAGMGTPPTALQPASPTTSPPAVPNRISPTDLPEICNCIPRFDSLGIEQGLSQSSGRVIFQDHQGFLWIGTEDGLNRYDGYDFTIFKRDPGNPNSISDGWINDIVEDRDGFLWVGTRLGGLNRYDPRTGTFAHFQHSEGNPASLADNHVTALLIDHENQLWVGTLSGLDLFDEQTESFRHIPFVVPQPSTEDGVNNTPDIDASTEEKDQEEPKAIVRSQKLSSKNISALYQDSTGHIWVGTLDGGLNRFDPETDSFAHYLPVPDYPGSISSSRVTSIAEDANGSLWIGTQNGLNVFDPVGERFSAFTHNNADPASIVSDSINVLRMDGSGNLWIGTSAGLDRLSEDRTHFVHYLNDPSFPRSLSNNQILSIYEDHGGVLWFGTHGGGINRYDRERDKFAYFRHNPEDPASLSGNFIFPIHVDNKGYAWVGTSGTGLNRFHWKTGANTRYFNNPDDPNSLSSDTVLSILQDREGILWFGTSNGLDRYDPSQEVFQHYRRDPTNPDSISANFVYTVFEDSRNQLWVGTFSGLDRFDKTSGVFTHFRSDPADESTLSGNKPLAITEDARGNLWIGTAEAGLNRMDPVTHLVRRYHHNPNDPTSLSGDSILSIYRDTNDRLWIGTAGAGLNLYHPDTDSFTHYVEKDGLPNGFVYGILEDEEGRLWMSTNFGITRFDPDTETFRNYDMGDGLQSNEFNSSAFAKGLEGEFYFGGISGLTVFHPLEITDNRYLPNVTLTSLKQEDQSFVGSSSVETLREITIAYPQNSFEFEFAALSFNQPDKNQYAYTLEGFDTNWHFTGTQRNGRYTNLPGGTYTLLLKAANSDGVWNETPTCVLVTVIPPFWQTLWFRVLLGAGMLALVAGGVRLRTKSIQDRNRALERLVTERTFALEKRNREMEALYQADERILRNVSLNQVFQTLVDVAVDMLNADRSVVFAWDEKQTRVVPRVSRGFKPETLKVLEFEKGEGIIGNVLETGQPVVVRQIELNEFRSDIRKALIEEGIRSFAHIPILVDRKIVGVFNIGFTTPNLIGDDTTRLFAALTQRASISIANMELFEQTKDLAVMEERNRLARDLHDSAKQKAFAALAQLGTVRSRLNGNADLVSIHLGEAENLVSDVIQELTFLVQEIYPIALQEKGLSAALRDYIYEWENRNDTTIQLVNRGEQRLPFDTEQALYRVAQEALANVARHSRAQRVDISLVYNRDSVQLLLADDGCGFDMEKKSYGMGLRSIRERVSSIRGTVQIQSAPGHGTRILVQAPIKN